MVMSEMGLPEPPDPDANLPSNPDISLHIESEPDSDDDNPYEGYERLPMAPLDPETSSEDEEESEPSHQDLPTVSTAEAEIVKEVWQAPARKDIEMDSEKVDQVKAALVNFTLPASNIPDWASQIPEEQWKEQIMKRLRDN